MKEAKRVYDAECASYEKAQNKWKMKMDRALGWMLLTMGHKWCNRMIRYRDPRVVYQKMAERYGGEREASSSSEVEERGLAKEVGVLASIES